MAGRYPGDSEFEHDGARDAMLGQGHPATPGQAQRATPGRAEDPAVLAGRFELQEVIGGGGMATVHRAWDRVTRRSCAVKVLADVLSIDEQFRLRFRQEAQAALGLTHPHIVAVHDYGESGPRHYIVMEYVARGTLRELLQREGALQEGTAARLASEVADALAYAHARGVIHRDIKPQNILLTEAGSAKVADFGIARTLDATRLTRTGFVAGSAQYLSPEQARGDPSGPASDLYALGVVLFEMLAGHVPFDGDTAVGIALKHLQEPAPDLRRIRPDISEATAALVARLLSKSDADRYPTAAALAVDLRRIASAHSRQRPQTTDAGVASGVAPEPDPASAPAGSSATSQIQLSTVDTVQLPRVPDRQAGAGRLAAAGANGTMAAGRAPRGEAAERLAARTGRSRWTPARWMAGIAMFVVLAGAGAALWRAEHHASVASTAARPRTGAATSAAADKGAVVPSLVGRTVAAASQAAGAVGLRLIVAERRPDASAAADTILAQDPPAGGRLDARAPLRVIVSQGTGIVPALEGLMVTAAMSRLESAGLRLGRTIESYGLGAETVGQVLSQSHPPGTHLTPGEPVDLVVSKGPLPPATPSSSEPAPPPRQESPPSSQPSNP